MSRSYTLLLSLCLVSTLCLGPTEAFELRQRSTSTSLCFVNTHISPNARFVENHQYETSNRYHPRRSQYTTGLYAQSDNSDENESSSLEHSNHNPKSLSRRQRLRKNLGRITKTLLLASALTFAAPRQAEAKFSHELKEERTLSLRPGVTQDQATKLNEGEIPDDLPEAPKTFLQSETSKVEIEKKKAVAKKKSFDYGDEEEDDDFDLEAEFKQSKTTAGRTAVARSDVEKANAFRAQTKSSFSGVARKSEAEKRLQTLKVGVAAFIPTFGAMFVREFVRRRKEERYVQKGLEILEAQKAEYFNITATTADSDIEDELKDLKDDDEDDDEEDDDDDDDEDDEEDDEDEDDEPPSRRKPKRPTGGDDSGGGGSSGDGDGRPSEEFLKRLGDIFNKS